MTPPATRTRLELTPLHADDGRDVRRWLSDFLRHHNRTWVRARGLGWSDGELDAQMAATDLVAEHWQMLVRASHQQTHHVAIARLDGRPVGGIWAEERTDTYLITPTGVLSWIYVAPWAREHGVGTVLLDDAKAWMTTRGLRSVTVNVLADNAPAMRLYRRLGLDVADVRMMGPLPASPRTRP